MLDPWLKYRNIFIIYITFTRRQLVFGIKDGDHNIPHHNNRSPVFCSISTSQLISPRESRGALTQIGRHTFRSRGYTVISGRRKTTKYTGRVTDLVYIYRYKKRRKCRDSVASLPPTMGGYGVIITEIDAEMGFFVYVQNTSRKVSCQHYYYTFILYRHLQRDL